MCRGNNIFTIKFYLKFGINALWYKHDEKYIIRLFLIQANDEYYKDVICRKREIIYRKANIFMVKFTLNLILMFVDTIHEILSYAYFET